MAVNMTIDEYEGRLRAIRRDHWDYEPDLTYEIDGKDVNVWLEVDHVSDEDIDNLVWITVVRLGDSWLSAY